MVNGKMAIDIMLKGEITCQELMRVTMADNFPYGISVFNMPK